MITALRKFKISYLIILASLLTLSGCGNEDRAIRMDGTSITKRIGNSLGMFVQKKEMTVNRIALFKNWTESGNPYYILVFANHKLLADVEKKTEEEIEMDEQFSFRFSLNASALDTILAVLEDPVSEVLEMSSAGAKGYFFTKYSETSQSINSGLYFKPYQGMLVITGSYWYLGETQVHIKASDAPKLANLINDLRDVVDK